MDAFKLNLESVRSEDFVEVPISIYTVQRGRPKIGFREFCFNHQIADVQVHFSAVYTTVLEWNAGL